MSRTNSNGWMHSCTYSLYWFLLIRCIIISVGIYLFSADSCVKLRANDGYVGYRSSIHFYPLHNGTAVGNH